LFPTTISFRRWLTPATAVLLITLLLTACADQTIMTSATIAAPSAQAEVVVWARGNAQDHQRANALLTAMQQEPALAGVAAQAEMYHIGGGSYASLWQAAYEDGRPPDILSLDMGDIPEWAADGRIVPLDDCLSRYPEFENVRPDLWPAVTWQGQRWGVPHELGLHLLYFNKSKLRQLGWSEADIGELPRRIQAGEFTREDLMATAAAAVQQGIVEPGFGFWPDPGRTAFLNVYAAAGGRLTDPDYPDKLILSRPALTAAYAEARRRQEAQISPAHAANTTWNQSFGRSVWQDAVTHGQVLFWSAPAWSWVRWAQYYVNDLGGEAYLADQVGFAPQPGGGVGQPGFAWAQVRFYAISAGLDEAAQARACQVLAAATTPTINLAHVMDNFYLTTLALAGDDPATAVYPSQPILQEMEELAAVGRMLPVHSQYGRYLSALSSTLRQVESDDLLPAAAADAAIADLQVELGDALIIEP